MNANQCLLLLTFCYGIFCAENTLARDAKHLTNADIINIDAIHNDQRHPVKVWLEQGVYEVEAVEPAAGGNYLARNAWEGETRHCDDQGLECTRGWQWAVVARSNSDKIFPTNHTLGNDKTVIWMPAIPKISDSVLQWSPPKQTAALAFQFRVKQMRFKLLETGFVDFFDPDSMPEDNVGGVSFRLIKKFINNDLDNDLFDDTEDAFPNNPYAAIDSDQDGYPDVWNLSGSDKTNNLTLDAFPNDPKQH